MLSSSVVVKDLRLNDKDSKSEDKNLQMVLKDKAFLETGLL